MSSTLASLKIVALRQTIASHRRASRWDRPPRFGDGTRRACLVKAVETLEEIIHDLILFRTAEIAVV